MRSGEEADSAGGAFRDKETSAYNKEYNFGNAPALHPEKFDLLAGQSCDSEK